MEIKRNPAATPFKGQPARIAPQPLDDLTLRWLRQMHQPLPTVQVAPPPVEVSTPTEI